MTTIWKYPLQLAIGQRVKLPKGAHLLHVAVQDNTLTAWALVDPTARLEERVISVFCTGSTLPAQGLRYVGTAIDAPARYVWHVFEHAAN